MDVRAITPSRTGCTCPSWAIRSERFLPTRSRHRASGQFVRLALSCPYNERWMCERSLPAVQAVPVLVGRSDLNASFQHVADTELLGNLCDWLFRALITNDGCASDHSQPYRLYLS